MLWSCSLIQLWASWHDCLELNFSGLEEHQKLQIMESFLQSQRLKYYGDNFIVFSYKFKYFYYSYSKIPIETKYIFFIHISIPHGPLKWELLTLPIPILLNIHLCSYPEAITLLQMKTAEGFHFFYPNKNILCVMKYELNAAKNRKSSVKYILVPTW